VTARFGKADQIYNLARRGVSGTLSERPVLTLKTSVLGALHALNLAAGSRARAFQASTSEVYGDPETSPQP
jgi:UDP-glucuronate decarboxylase